MARLITILFVMLILTSCGANTPVQIERERYEDMYNNTTVVIENDKETTLRRVIDNEADIVCYTFLGSNGIYCLPLNQTNLK